MAQLRLASLATSPARMDRINHIRAAVLARGQEAHITGAEQVARLNPLYDAKTAGVLGALFSPDDGHLDPSGTCQAITTSLHHDVVTDAVPEFESTDHEIPVTRDAVVVEGRYRNSDGYTSAADFLFKIDEGKIISRQMRYWRFANNASPTSARHCIAGCGDVFRTR